MSVLISGMEMPTSCEDCPLGDNLHCQVLPSVPALWAEYTNAIREKRLHSDCPLVPVPEHGPLVDALDVINTFPEEFIFTNEQARALTNYIIPADPAKEGEG